MMPRMYLYWAHAEAILNSNKCIKANNKYLCTLLSGTIILSLSRYIVDNGNLLAIFSWRRSLIVQCVAVQYSCPTVETKITIQRLHLRIQVSIRKYKNAVTIQLIPSAFPVHFSCQNAKPYWDATPKQPNAKHKKWKGKKVS